MLWHKNIKWLCFVYLHNEGILLARVAASVWPFSLWGWGFSPRLGRVVWLWYMHRHLLCLLIVQEMCLLWPLGHCKLIWDFASICFAFARLAAWLAHMIPPCPRVRISVFPYFDTCCWHSSQSHRTPLATKRKAIDWGVSWCVVANKIYVLRLGCLEEQDAEDSPDISNAAKAGLTFDILAGRPLDSCNMRIPL